jgi:class 3 adenylate cyclase
MSFFETLTRARAWLRDHGRVSVNGLKREFGLDDHGVAQLIEELVDVQQVAVRQGGVLAWAGPDDDVSPALSREPPPGMVAERRQLTVLFCDLVDSTSLAAGRDPEDWRDVVVAYQRVVGAVIDRFDGHVAQYLGDGILAYFGYPRAHEDDAERAVRAAIGMVESLPALNRELTARGGPAVSIRIGIHTGPVVVGEMGGGAGRRETLALGDTTNVAARLQGEAEPDMVVLSPATLRLVQGIFVTHDLGERALKGVAEPVRVTQAVRPSGMRSRLDVAAATGLTPLVGRAAELRKLAAHYASASAGGGRAVLLGGDPGIGKSRIVQSFRDALSARPHSWLECRTSPYTTDSAFFPVLELQRQGLGFDADDDADAKVARLETSLRDAGFVLDDVMPLAAHFHSLPLPERYAPLDVNPEAVRRGTFDFLREWLLRIGRVQTVVLLVEDLHWIDPSTLELLDRIIAHIAAAPMLLLMTHRPEFTPPWQTERSRCRAHRP